MSIKTNPHNLPQWYLDQSSSDALTRLKANGYPVSTLFSVANDALLILTHYSEDLNQSHEKINMPFYADSFMIIFQKFWKTSSADIFIKYVLDAIEQRPTDAAWASLLNIMHILYGEHKPLYNRVAGLEKRIASVKGK